MARNVTYSVSPRINPRDKEAAPKYLCRNRGHRAFLEGWGTGVSRMVEACKAVGLPEPEYGADGLFVWITFKRPKASEVIENIKKERDFFKSLSFSDPLGARTQDPNIKRVRTGTENQ